MPLLKAKQALSKLSSGQILKLIATDAGSARDVPAYVELTDHQLLHSFYDESKNKYTYFIQKA